MKLVARPNVYRFGVLYLSFFALLSSQIGFAQGHHWTDPQGNGFRARQRLGRPTAPPLPDCYDGPRQLPIDNQAVIQWKSTTANQTLKRARVGGVIGRLFPNKTNHNHFELKIGPNPEDVIEVVYNFAFGPLPPLHLGQRVEACGDYITSIAPAGHYPASPSGAIIHWVHRNPKRPPLRLHNRNDDMDTNEHGYVIIEGQLFGWRLPPKRFRGMFQAEATREWPSTQNSYRQNSR
jgi:hypothetical protein